MNVMTLPSFTSHKYRQQAADVDMMQEDGDVQQIHSRYVKGHPSFLREYYEVAVNIPYYYSVTWERLSAGKHMCLLGDGQARGKHRESGSGSPA